MKVAVIGAGNVGVLEELAKVAKKTGENIEIVCVPDENIKVENRIILEKPELMEPEALPTFFEKPKKVKSHIRPYKYHR